MLAYVYYLLGLIVQSDCNNDQKLKGQGDKVRISLSVCVTLWLVIKEWQIVKKIQILCTGSTTGVRTGCCSKGQAEVQCRRQHARRSVLLTILLSFKLESQWKWRHSIESIRVSVCVLQ